MLNIIKILIKCIQFIHVYCLFFLSFFLFDNHLHLTTCMVFDNKTKWTEFFKETEREKDRRRKSKRILLTTYDQQKNPTMKDKCCWSKQKTLLALTCFYSEWEKRKQSTERAMLEKIYWIFFDLLNDKRNDEVLHFQTSK